MFIYYRQCEYEEGMKNLQNTLECLEKLIKYNSFLLNSESSHTVKQNYRH
jgi:hypothetical protein